MSDAMTGGFDGLHALTIKGGELQLDGFGLKGLTEYSIGQAPNRLPEATIKLFVKRGVNLEGAAGLEAKQQAQPTEIALMLDGREIARLLAKNPG